jgi:hypothetical protein
MATLTAPLIPVARIPGGAFLIADATPADCFFPEDFTDEHRQIAQTTGDFAANEILPANDAIEAKDFAVTRRLLREASELGLTSVDIPEEYGGLEMDKVTSAIVAENIAQQGSFSVIFSAHVGIGTLPIVWYGTPAQKQRYLPKLARASSSAPTRSRSRPPARTPSTPAPAPCSAPTAPPTPSTARRCGPPTPAWPTSSPSSPNVLFPARNPASQDEKLTAFLIEKRNARPHRRPRGAQARHPRLVHLPAHPHRLQNPRREPARRSRQGPSHRLQHPQHRPLQAGRRGGRRRQAHSLNHAIKLRQRAQGLRQGHLRVWPGAGEDRRLRRRHLRRRGPLLPHHRQHRRRARRHRPNDTAEIQKPHRGARGRVLHRQGLGVGDERHASSTTWSRSSAAMATSRSIPPSAPTATRASTASSRAPTRSTGSSSPAGSSKSAVSGKLPCSRHQDR